MHTRPHTPDPRPATAILFVRCPCPVFRVGCAARGGRGHGARVSVATPPAQRSCSPQTLLPPRAPRLRPRTAPRAHTPPLPLGPSQYRYKSEKLHDLYLRYKNEHHDVYVNTATTSIANVACNFSAYTFFNDKQGIALSMQEQLNKVFETQLFAHVEALQITQVELPVSFQDAILESISTKQNITRSMRYKDNMAVTFETQKMVSSQVANQTVILARGQAARKLQQAQANAAMTAQTVQAEMTSYGNISQQLHFEGKDGLNYLWWDSLATAAAHNESAGKEFLVGLDPAAYISAK